MSNVVKLPARSNRLPSIYQVHYCLPKPPEEEMAKPLSEDVQAYGRQVAGHMKMENSKYLGVLQCGNGTILKPIIKSNQKREIDFYETIKEAKRSELVELRQFTPKYFGVRKFTYNGFQQDYLVLEDLAERMFEPCIMDVKIGKRTWDPLAKPEKIKSEQEKYRQCKQQFGFCIPGYHVYKLANGKLYKHNKDHGKKLHGHMVITALRDYLNGLGTSLCRTLILHLLSSLWQIQRWVSKQTAVKLYSSSLLLCYDATKLRSCCGDMEYKRQCRTPKKARRKSIPSLSSSDSSSSFSGLVSQKGPIFNKVNSVPLTPMSLAQSAFAPHSPVKSSWTEALERLNLNHSFDHNYEEKLSKIKVNYRALLDQLSSDSPTPNLWGTVKIIDFAHAFFNEDDNLTGDDNFREGIDSLVNIFEGFLRETDDQVF